MQKVLNSLAGIQVYSNIKNLQDELENGRAMKLQKKMYQVPLCNKKKQNTMGMKLKILLKRLV